MVEAVGGLGGCVVYACAHEGEGEEHQGREQRGWNTGQIWFFRRRPKTVCSFKTSMQQHSESIPEVGSRLGFQTSLDPESCSTQFVWIRPNGPYLHLFTVPPRTLGVLVVVRMPGYSGDSVTFFDSGDLVTSLGKSLSAAQVTWSTPKS